MKKYLKTLILFAAPLMVAAFCLATAKSKFVCDGVSFTAYGFPLLWTMPGATSLSTAIDLQNLIVDLTVYFAVFAAISATGLFDKIFGNKLLLSAVLLWTSAALVSGLFIIFISIDPYLHKIEFGDACSEQLYAPHFGFPLGR